VDVTRPIKTWLAALACIAMLAQPRRAAAEAAELRIGVQFGLTYLPLTIMRQEHYVEQQARAMGLGDVKVTWIQAAGGDSLNDALLSGNLDVAASGYTSFLILWSKTKGRFAKALFGYGHTPFTLVTRNPDVKTVADLSDKDRIAVPAVRSSLQAIYLQMAAEKAFGPQNLTRFDHLTLSRSHPDAMAAMLGNTELDSHFAVPPYTERELATPGLHALFQTEDVTGEPISNGVMYAPAKFYDANPKLLQALRGALEQALELIKTDKPKAAQIYLAATHETIDPAALAGMMSGKGVGYELTPLGSMRLAGFMHKTGQIAMEPADWKDMFFPIAYDLPGN
jgi:NitT/TauT family transport system substrate-binding protein